MFYVMAIGLQNYKYLHEKKKIKIKITNKKGSINYLLKSSLNAKIQKLFVFLNNAWNNIYIFELLYSIDGLTTSKWSIIKPWDQNFD